MAVPLQPLLISFIILLYFPFHAYNKHLFPYGHIMDHYAKLCEMNQSIHHIINTVTLIIIQSTCISMCYYFARC